MTASSPMTASSDAPGLTVATTAGTSPSLQSPTSVRSRSPSLTPPPDERSKSASKRVVAATKRKSLASTAAEDTPKKKAKQTPAASKAAAKPEAKGDAEKAEKGTYCHQCRTKCDPERVLRCTRLRKYTKNAPPRACNLAWCERDLIKRYEIHPDEVRKRGHNVGADEMAKHDADKAYVFACPCCIDECQNATCRQKKGLENLGDVIKLSSEQGITPLEFVRRANEKGPQPTRKSREDAESDLTDIDAAPKKATGKKAATPAKGKKATTSKATKATTKSTAKSAAKSTPKGKAKAAAKPAAKGKDAKKGTKTAAAKDTKKAKEPKEVKPKKFELPVVEPPIFNTVNTRMTYNELENRLYVREFVNRFRGILGIPDRAIAHLDDFDHPLSEASVRQIAGGLLDLIIQDRGYSTGVDPEDIEMIEDKREELRHYADLARFAQVYKEIAEPLNLKMPPAESERDRNDRAVRALLDLGENDPAPSWAFESTGPSRRAAASRLPSPSEVVRMLMALIEHVIYLEGVRATMDPAVGNSYNDYVRKNVQYNREENARWETEKKSLMAARVRCKSAEQTRANKAKFDAAQNEHYLRIRAGQVTLNAIAARKQTKFAPLGTDYDGRVYFALSPRLIDEERYRPSGWTRGIMVWGPGIEGQAAQDELPTKVPRWSHFSTAASVRQLSRWLRNRVLRAIDEAEEEEQKQAKVTKKTPKKAANGVANGTPGRRSSAFEGVIIPTRRANGDDDASDAESELSEAPHSTEELLALLDPPGYKPSVDKLKEDMGFTNAVDQVALLLECLEWKGYA